MLCAALCSGLPSSPGGEVELSGVPAQSRFACSSAVDSSLLTLCPGDFHQSTLGMRTKWLGLLWGLPELTQSVRAKDEIGSRV